ncbi:LysR family transcriptional regulator [Anaeropeptidivorans aminofermentans]|jgi:DNA-binding transcriptional LysR family regulator|uniref:LysR family transcriptional regulator n=1 Tax=Anaeropeptidivorans aminofermentans TaxID=2934315 RepID=UPI0020250A5C|nr:LysR family transcriptional regulator [Anaeropeptidivorans aminofermentans]
MTMEHLAYILEINRYRSINRASKTLFISQPTLSSILKNIENEIGYRIFDRTTTGIIPTEQGKKFIESAEKMFNEYKRMKLVPDINYESENLSISASSSSMFSNAFFSYKKDHPVNFSSRDIYREEVLDQNFQDVITRRCRMGLTYFSRYDLEIYRNYAVNNNLELKVLKEGLPIKIAVYKDHPLAKRDKVDFDELIQYPFVTYDDLDFEKNLGAVGVDSEGSDIQFISSRASYYDAIRLCGYIAFSFDFAPDEAERLECVCLNLDNVDDDYVVVYFTCDDYILNEREKHFIEYLKNYMDKNFSYNK